MRQEKKRKVYLSYRDDNDKLKTGWVWLISLEQDFCVFETDVNRVRIPISRLCKIKESKEEAREDENNSF